MEDDFGFLKEAREEVLDSNSLFTNRDKFAGAVSAELKEQNSIEAFSAFGAVGLLLIIPFVTSMERGRIARWAQNPPPANRRLRKKSRFKHGN